MKKYSFLSGIGIAIILTIIFLLIHSTNLAFEVPGIIGIICLMAAGISSGAFVSGDRTRENYFMESPENRKQRNTITTTLVLFGSPNFIVAICVYLLFGH